MSKTDKKRSKPIVEKRLRIQDTFPCPQCGHECRKHRLGHRKLQNLNHGRPLYIELTYSVHYCPKCEKHFNIDMSDLAAPGSPYTCDVVSFALYFVIKDKLSCREASYQLLKKHNVSVSFTTIQRWANVEKREKKYFADDILPSNK